MTHTWNWLPSRFTRFVPGKACPSRPCLAMMEPLEDRLLLSTAGSTDSAGILIGLLRNQLALNSGQINVLKVASGELVAGDKTMQTAFLKIEEDFLKIDGAILDVGVDALSGQKIDTTHKVDLALADIDSQVKLFGNSDGAGLLLPAVQKVREAALGTFKIASGLPQAIKGEIKLDLAFVKIEADLLKIDVQLLKLSAADFKGTLTADKSSDAVLKIDAAFVKIDAGIAAMGDGSVFQLAIADADALKIDTLSFINTLTAPPTVPTTPTFTGVALPGVAGDVIG